MNHRFPPATPDLRAAPGGQGSGRPDRAPALARRENEEMRHALIQSQVALASANAILLAMVSAFDGRPDDAVPAYVREARVHLGQRH
jgi:hypothetical protein